MPSRVVVASALLVIALLIALALRSGAAHPNAARVEPASDTARPAEPRAGVAPPLRSDDSARATTETATPTPPASAVAAPPPAPALRAAFERESPDATAHRDEARLRAIYGAERDADTILRDVRCTRSVCKLDLRWSPELNQPYNNALLAAIKAFSRDIDLTPDVTLGGPEMPIPMTLFIARPGNSVESLLAEQAAATPRR